MLNILKNVDTGRTDGPIQTPSILAEDGMRLAFCPNVCGVLIHRHGPELGPRAAHCATDRPGGYELTEPTPLQASVLHDLIDFMERRHWRPVHRGRPRILAAPLVSALAATL